ncbi:hypothetical protein F4775DRAFT_86580 [Biscogniauxia sp. FL1348]|nr:hypothetical protein F4775DRAFT_86580 [Biscogniauxia sp. FL1348]
MEKMHILIIYDHQLLLAYSPLFFLFSFSFFFLMYQSQVQTGKEDGCKCNRSLRVVLVFILIYMVVGLVVVGISFFLPFR